MPAVLPLAVRVWPEYTGRQNVPCQIGEFVDVCSLVRPVWGEKDIVRRRVEGVADVHPELVEGGPAELGLMPEGAERWRSSDTRGSGRLRVSALGLTRWHARK